MIQINLFNSSANQYRLPLVKCALQELSNITEENKQKIHLVAFFHEFNQNEWIQLLEPVVDSGIAVSTVPLQSDEYDLKMQVVQQSSAEYICKWDDDVFINHHVWNFMIENVNQLDDSNISVIAPTLSNGMSSVELFIKDFLTQSETEHVHSIFLQDNIDPNIFGCNYHSIREHILNLTSWDGDAYWKLIDEHDPTVSRNVPWYYKIVKGVHPARFSYDYNMFVANHAIQNKDVILQKQDYYLDQYITPYFCNNLFIANRDFYLNAQKLFFDHWDEGQLTMYAMQQQKSPAYIRNCYGIHMAYGCTNGQREIEEYYIKNLFEKLV
jgi:hypothetical protein